MRRAPTGQMLQSGLQNGTVIQVFNGTSTGSPVSFNGTLTATGFPANSPFVKLRPESLLRFVIECDLVPGSGNDTIWLYLYVDGSLIQGVAHQFNSSDEASIVMVLDGDSTIRQLAAGSHTVEIKVSSTQNHTCSLLCNGSCGFQIIEYL